MSKQSWEGDYDRGYDRGYADGARYAVANARRDALEWAAKTMRGRSGEIWQIFPGAHPTLMYQISSAISKLADEIEKGEQ